VHIKDRQDGSEGKSTKIGDDAKDHHLDDCHDYNTSALSPRVSLGQNDE